MPDQLFCNISGRSTRCARVNLIDLAPCNVLLAQSVSRLTGSRKQTYDRRVGPKERSDNRDKTECFRWQILIMAIGDTFRPPAGTIRVYDRLQQRGSPKRARG